MDRVHEHSLYSSSSPFRARPVPQTGGDKRRSPTKTGKTYTPPDTDEETSTALDKFRKANRLLQKELNEVKDALEKEKNLNKKLTQQLKSYQL